VRGGRENKRKWQKVGEKMVVKAREEVRGW
jgi:hypothetical protein